ncbi:hypothetical protein E2562_006470 [Oryza meyeriana var. granulata]|uniref:Uncharacterized protein n=1 Tax=Oryza meyeriana var. granulata TaxID=110450 RepID=A0A6G1CPU6_9ORYZ|nr:hypothetical protein E2562_006470 [Oryza meyeriana var. granulata]
MCMLLVKATARPLQLARPSLPLLRARPPAQLLARPSLPLLPARLPVWAAAAAAARRADA